ncbi:FT-interacting protein 1-like [Iris pallida]|nr:FT-interacting protein 1-like [Iris pallida]
MLLKLQLLHERALHRGQLKVAQQLSYKFGVLASPVIGVDMEIKTEASLIDCGAHSQMDTRLSHADSAHPDELDEEFDTFHTSRPSDI